MKLRTNTDRLVEISVIGEVDSPLVRGSPYRVSAEGKPQILPGVGGICYNVLVGGPACGWQADHVEPGVSLRNHKEGEEQNAALNVYAQIGNVATVVSGDAKGARGTVTGKHGGIEHLLADFPSGAMDKMAIGDRVQVRAFGLGLELADFPEVTAVNLDPDVLPKLSLARSRSGALTVAVAAEVPARIMGSGLGHDSVHRGDYDVQLNDERTVREYGLDRLRFGDLVAITDADHRWGRIYRRGAVSIGVIVHSACILAGHGPGVTTIFTGAPGSLGFRLDRRANLAPLLGIGASRRGGRPAAFERRRPARARAS